jgi:hypothetical protein
MSQRTLGSPSLEEVLQDFATSDDPMPARLSRFMAMFPEHEADLRAVAFDVTALQSTPAPEELSRHDMQLSAFGAERLAHVFDDLRPQAAVRKDVLAAITARELRAVAKKVDLPVLFLEKLKQHLIDAATMPRSFVNWLAEAIGASEDDLMLSLRQPAAAGISSQFRLDGTAGDTTQTFEQAIETSALTVEQQDRLRRFLAD